MLRYRAVDVKRDEKILLEFHCRINYESETPYARTVPYEQYRKKWLSTSQPREYLSHLAATMKDERTMAEILEDKGSVVGYLWVTFNDIHDYNLTIAEIMDIAVASSHQRRGIGLSMLRRIEEVARRKGATLIRSDTGVENTASQKLHEKFGFKPYRIHYEKIIR
jgi:ribosomal protein S18 acetylase RimI-like enzyme